MTTKTPNVPTIAAEISLDMPTVGMSPNDALRLTFADGRSLVVQVGDLSGPILAQATMHGLKQKLVDAAAISRDPETGRAATLETKFAAVNEVLNRLLSGEWNKTREGGGSSGGLLRTALVRLYDGKKSPEEIDAYLATKSDAEKTALRGNSKVAAIIEAIKAERAKAGGIDSNALLGELEG